MLSSRSSKAQPRRGNAELFPGGNLRLVRSHVARPLLDEPLSRRLPFVPVAVSSRPGRTWSWSRGGAIFALYEVSTALSEREQRRLEAAGGGPVAKVATKVRELVAWKTSCCRVQCGASC